MKKWFTLLLLPFFIGSACAESVTVTASKLNARVEPNRHALIECIYERDDSLEAVAYIKGGWVEISYPPSTLFVKAEYVSETSEPVRMKNISGGRVRVRREPCADSKAIDFIGKNKTVTVTGTLLGWGRTRRGWIDLSNFDTLDHQER